MKPPPGMVELPDQPGVFHWPGRSDLYFEEASNRWFTPSAPDGQVPDQPVRDSTFAPQPLDWDELQKVGVPVIEYLRQPYLPAGARVWVFGAASTAKSLWALAIASELTRAGHRVVFVSQENPLVEDVRRLERLRPDWSHLAFFPGQGFDLARPDHVDVLATIASGAVLIVLDTVSACWSGKEDDNAAIAAFDRDVLYRLVQETGASVVVLDHVGHPQAFVARRGVNAGRGASAKGQKADVVLEFRARGPGEFVVTHAKNRLGGRLEPDRAFRVVDTEDGGLEVVAAEVASDSRIQSMADAMVEAIERAGSLSTKALREAVRGGRELQGEAMRLLETESPARVVAAMEAVDTEARGKQRAKVWRLALPGRRYPDGVPTVSGDSVDGRSDGVRNGAFIGTGDTVTPSPPEHETVSGSGVTLEEAVARIRAEFDAEVVS